MDKLRLILKNPHFWITSLLLLFPILIYQAWPWREWNLSPSPFHWIGWLSYLYDLAVLELKYQFVGSLFLIPIIYSIVKFRWRGSLIALSLALVGILPILKEIWTNTSYLITNISLLLLPTGAGLAVNLELELRRKDKMVFIEREKERQLYVSKIMEIQERERQRIAEELHDESVQAILAIASYAEFIESTDLDNINETKKKARWIKIKSRKVVKDLRRMSIDLRPSILDNMGLVPALNWLTNRVKKEHKISIHLTTIGSDDNISPSVSITIFRIVQESLQNIVRHAKASEVLINLKIETNSLIMTIQDNGLGFIPPARNVNLVTKGKLGIVGMQERIRSINGIFEIRSKPKGGTLIFVKVPIKSV